VRTFTVVVADMAAQDSIEVAAPEDEQVIGAFSTHGAHPALGEGIRLRLSGQSEIGSPVGPDNRYYIRPIDAVSLHPRRIAIGRIIGGT
jgi:hypothetical protein